MEPSDPREGNHPRALVEMEGASSQRPILVVAGEASGDALGAGLIRAARRLDPDVRFVGIGGAAMREAGAEILLDAEEIAVVGVLEVLARLPRLLAARQLLREALRRERPRKVLLIDYPDFNLRFAPEAKRSGAKVHYFVSPQLWAWRPGRIRTIARTVDLMMVVFPFEVEIYRKAGVPVVFVGHPLVDMEPPPIERTEARTRLGLDANGRVLALLPGSRRGEVSRLLPVQLAAASRLRASRPDLAVVIPVASTVPEGLVDGLLRAAGAETWARAVRGLFPETLDASDAACVASGTATLQAGMRGTPMAVVYKVRPSTAWLGRRLVKLTSFALVNLVAGHRVVPELIQEDCTPERIEEALVPLLDDPSAAARMRAELAGIRSRLGAPGAFDRAAALVLGSDAD
jgi:lipid-A-disaccharide synthase